MKNCMLIFCGILILTSCSEENAQESIMGCSKVQESHTTELGTTITLTSQDWEIYHNGNGGGSIKLSIEGSITGDSATIRTYGDGLIIDVNLELNEKKEFDRTVTTAFYVNWLPENDIHGRTTITVFGTSDTLEVPLQGCLLRY